MSKQFPQRASIVVIGGGIMGSSTAYHLLCRGWQDVVLLEKDKLTSGSTWHAAGAVGQLRRSPGITRMIGYSVDLYGRLEEETGLSTGWKQCGSIRLACTPERVEELERSVEIGRSIGLDFQMIGLDDVKAKVPVASLDGVLAAAYIPTDGMINPTDVTMSLAKGIRQRGGLIFEDTPVTGFDVEEGRVRTVVTPKGSIRCEKVVLCGGIWSREVGRLAGVNVPLQPNHDQYAISDVIPGLPRNSPNLRDPDNHIYFKEEVGGYSFGSYDQDPIAFDVSPIPENHAFHLFEPDVDHFASTVDDAVRRIPTLADVGIKRFIHGLESFTEDSMPIMGEAPELRDFYVVAGFNGFGIASGGGAGKAMADWITDGQPPFDLGAADIRRFGPHHASDRMVRALALDGQRRHYALDRSGDEARMARKVRRSPAFQALAAAGASFSQVVGWETAEYFQQDREVDVARLVDEEFTAAKQAVALIDDSSRAKFLILGNKAQIVARALLPAGEPFGADAVTTGLALNRLGGIECDVIVSGGANESLRLGCAAARSRYLESYLVHRHELLGGVDFIDMTSATGLFLLVGPNAPALLGDVFEGPHPRPGQRVSGFLAGAPVTLGAVERFQGVQFEIEVSTEYAAYVFEGLHGAGAAHGLRLAGTKAVEKLRLEKGLPAFGREIHAGTRPWQIAPGTAEVDPSESVLKHLFLAGSGYTPVGHEGILKGSERVGVVTSAEYSPISNGSFVLAYVDAGAADDALHLQDRNGNRFPLSLYDNVRQ